MGLSEVLKRETAAHHRVPEDEDECPGEEGALGPGQPREVAHRTDEESADHLRGPVEGRVAGGAVSISVGVNFDVIIRVGVSLGWDATVKAFATHRVRPSRSNDVPFMMFCWYE
jgi:hypothetical protein